MTQFNQQVRVTGIEHRITPDKWIVNIEFSGDNRVASPQATPDLSNAVAVDTGWLAPTYGTGWTDWSDTANELARYRKRGTTVRVVGLCQRTSGAGVVALTLPSGYRPTRNTWRTCTVNGGPGTCYVATDGTVNMWTAVTNGWFISFDIEFDTDQP